MEDVVTGRILWEGVADNCPCRIIASYPFVYVQWLNADGTGACWPQPADGKLRNDRNAKERAFEQAVLDLSRELDALKQP